MNIRTTYFIFCIIGFVLPYSKFVPWILTHGLDVQLFFQELFSTHIGGFFGFDVIVSACTLTLFIVVEGRRLQMKKIWISVVGTFLVGVSFGLPLFLYMRHNYNLVTNSQLSKGA